MTGCAVKNDIFGEENLNGKERKVDGLVLILFIYHSFSFI